MKTKREKRKLKILFVGAGEFPIYESALFNAAKKIENIDCELFTWHNYFPKKGFARAIVNRFELKTSIGIDISRFSRDFFNKCKKERPDIVFLYSCRLLHWKTVKKVRTLGIYIANYCNDDPFSKFHKPYYWRNWRKFTRYSDINYVYRKKNMNDVKRISNKPVKLLLPYYIKESNYQCETGHLISDTPEVIFLGHKEDDERIDYIRELLRQGMRVGLGKGEFDFLSGESDGVVILKEPRKKYNQYICSCKIPIVFLSKINNDTYTRRCFEIPAAGAFLFCPYTKDLAQMFEEDKEIVFYHNKAEFVEKIKYYLNHDTERKMIAKAGSERLFHDGYEALDRVREIITDYYTIRKA